MVALKAISQQEFQKCFEQWQHHWATCIVVHGVLQRQPLSVSSKYTGMLERIVLLDFIHRLVSQKTPSSESYRNYRYACNKIIPGTS
jgi:hypothetical protein